MTVTSVAWRHRCCFWPPRCSSNLFGGPFSTGVAELVAKPELWSKLVDVLKHKRLVGRSCRIHELIVNYNAFLEQVDEHTQCPTCRESEKVACDSF